jgi:DNA mismatch endonuclease, patch repair protein
MKCGRLVDILLRGTWIAVFVDGHFWHWCPGHGHLPKTDTPAGGV